MLGFLILMVVTIGGTVLALGAATGILLILFHLMQPAGFNPSIRPTAFASKRP